MCRNGKSLSEIGLAHQQVAGLAAHVDEILLHLQKAAAQALELQARLRSAERTLAEAGHDHGGGITVTPVPAAHSNPT